MRNGESITQAITRIRGGIIDGIPVQGIIDVSKRQAGALASTGINAVQNNARLATFQENQDVIKGAQQVSTLDNKTSDVCIAYSGKAWKIDTLEPIDLGDGILPFNGGPPRHFNCRSTLVPVLKSFEEMGIPLDEIPPGTRASMDGQVPGDTTFNKFLSGKSKAFQDTLLGPARAKLWRGNKITLTQLVDMRGNPLTITQLEAKVAPPKKKVVPPKKKAEQQLFPGKTDAEEQMLLNSFTDKTSPLMKKTIQNTEPLEAYVNTPAGAKAIGRARSDGAWYQPWDKKIVNLEGNTGAVAPALRAVDRHEFGHHIDSARSREFFTKRGIKPPISRDGPQFNVSAGLDDALNKTKKKIAPTARAKRNLSTIRIEHQDAAAKHMLAQGSNAKELRKYYAPKLKKFGIDYNEYTRMVKRAYVADTAEQLQNALETTLSELLASFEVGSPSQVIAPWSSALKLRKGGTMPAMISDYLGAVTKNKVRGNWGHTTAYYNRGKFWKHKEAFANSVAMLGDPEFAGLWKTILKNWNADDFLLAVEDALKGLL